MTDAATRPWESHYTITDTTIIAETPDLRVLELTLGPGEEVPWHVHSQVDDRFYCLAGAIEVLTRKPDETQALEAGASCRVPHGRAHRVVNAAPADATSRFVLVQGPGKYDFVPLR